MMKKRSVVQILWYLSKADIFSQSIGFSRTGKQQLAQDALDLKFRQMRCTTFLSMTEVHKNLFDDPQIRFPNSQVLLIQMWREIWRFLFTSFKATLFNLTLNSQVEHVNAQFKAGLIHLCGNYTDAALQRVAKSLDTAKHLKDKLYPNYIEGY